MKILESTLVPICSKHRSFVGIVISDMSPCREYASAEQLHKALVEFIKYRGTLRINHNKSIIGFIEDHSFGLAWSQEPFHLHEGYLVRGKIIGPTWIWKNLKNGFYRGLSINPEMVDNQLKINEISLTDQPAYLYESNSCPSRSMGGGDRIKWI